MDRELIELLARRAGLDKALAEFPEDEACRLLNDGFRDREIALIVCHENRRR